MIEMTCREIAAVVGGRPVHDEHGPTVTAAAFVDSRLTERGGLFVAVTGSKVDGHDYVEAAFDAGAAAVLSSRDTGRPGVVVEDPVVALGRLARHCLSRLPDVRVVAVTGSQGKTSCKDLLAQVLTAGTTWGTTVATFGSFNNELGLPLTVLRADAATEFLVLEMGARHVGDLHASCQVAPPDVSLVLNVGKAHIGEFGSQERIAQAKGEIVEALGSDGIAVLNADDPLVAAMASRTRGRVRTFGTVAGSADADVRVGGVHLDELGRPSFTLHAAGEQADVSMQLVGEHHAINAAAATAVALALGLPLGEVAAALGKATATSRGRMEVRERADGVVVIDDAYNANPDSMRAALKALAAVGSGRPAARTVAVLGEMRELGDAGQAEHDAVGRLAVRLDIDHLVVVGEPARAMHLGACLEGSWGGESVFVPSPEAALEWLDDHLRPGDVVLFKASNVVQLSRLAEQVMAL
jgi:UDP-N-acetylmuramoyl-tripeptide--D-alanyl-D-alanine ligase